MIRTFQFLAALLLLVSGSSLHAQNEQDTMVGFTASARDSRGGTDNIVAQIRQGLLNTNLAHERSQTNARVVERMIGEFSITESGRDTGGMLGEWRRKRGGTSFGQDQAFWETQLGIDFAMIISNAASGGSNGQAENTGVYSSVLVGRITQPTLPHELGHNYGCVHERGLFNFRNSSGQLRRTLLESRGAGYGTVVNNYSNPNVNVEGVVSGTTAMDNAGRINERSLGRTNVRARNTNVSPSDPNVAVVDLAADRYDYDIGPLSGPVQGGWTPITPTTNGDISWSREPRSVDRGTTPGQNAINQDFVFDSVPTTLTHRLENGLWQVAMNMTDLSFPHDNMSVSAEGGQVVISNITRPAGTPQTFSYIVGVFDGALDITVSDEGGSDANWVWSRLSISRITDSNFDSDRDGLRDAWELEFFGNLTSASGGSADSDNDGLTDVQEEALNSNPTQRDSDGDGLEDADEVNLHGSSPTLADTDSDGYSDNAEVIHRSDPSSASSRPNIPGLVAYYSFDEGSGTTASDLATADGAQNASQDSGTIGWTSTGAIIGGGALDLDGSSSLNAASALPVGTTELSFSAWVNPDADGGYKGIYSGRGNAPEANRGNWGLNVENSHADFRFGGDGNFSVGVDSADSSVLASGGWIHLAMTWEAATRTGRIYLNGVLVGTRTNLSNVYLDPARGYFIGNDPAVGGRTFNGQIDDLAVFNRVLDSDEVAQIHTRGRAGASFAEAVDALPITRPVVAEFRFEQNGSNGNRDVRFSFPSDRNVRYDVFTSTDLSTWLPIQTNVAGTGEAIEVIHPSGGQDTRRFYQVRVR